MQQEPQDVNIACERTRQLWHALQTGPAVAGNAIAFLIPLGSRVLADYADAARRVAGVRVVQREFDTGFDSMTRAVTTVSSNLAPELFTWLRAEGVRVVVTHNTYLVDQNRAGGYQVLSLAAALGIEWISCDFDTYEGMVSEQLVAKDIPAFRRFTIEPHNTAEWLPFVARTRWEPLPVRLCADVPPRCHPVEPGSPLVMAANARVDAVIDVLPQVLLVLERCDPAHLYRDSALWYYALRRMLMQDNQREPLALVDFWIGRLFRVLLGLVAFQKYVVLDALADRYPVQLFGDRRWAELFPACYQQRYLTETEYVDLFRRRGAIGLLANDNFSYLNNNPVFVRALTLGAPFFCFEALVCPPPYAAFRLHEYGDAESLLRKVACVNEQAESDALEACRQRYAAMHREHAEAFGRVLCQPNAYPADTQFLRDLDAQYASWYPVVDQYIAQHWQQLIADMVLLRGPLPPDAEIVQGSRYGARPFVRALAAQRAHWLATR